jgi:hypothetical protein
MCICDYCERKKCIHFKQEKDKIFIVSTCTSSVVSYDNINKKCLSFKEKVEDKKPKVNEHIKLLVDFLSSLLGYEIGSPCELSIYSYSLIRDDNGIYEYNVKFRER